MVLSPLIRPALAGLLILVAAGGATAQRTPALTALNGIERGQWQFRGADGAVRNMCLRNPAVLLQIMHANAPCQQFVMENSAAAATVRYTCPSHGHGRTTIAVETPRVVTVDTQGVADGSPFAERLEGRRTGACG
ncbi:DUF3617 domain-containing protein [Sphingomonas sp. M1-B02]|uniref:DUF3617 domain-containing protein n=1 Tax=Sphingomonas sp. M1-B02 TaxID=3114300 RepID=UPI00223F35DB|nr:hypothetical protein [Sphingomonas sp. S6-11]UZK66014.1 hypothetical protein OKW87_16130 [Sphingomonas sp. S6-11]